MSNEAADLMTVVVVLMLITATVIILITTAVITVLSFRMTTKIHFTLKGSSTEVTGERFKTRMLSGVCDEVGGL